MTSQKTIQDKSRLSLHVWYQITLYKLLTKYKTLVVHHLLPVMQEEMNENKAFIFDENGKITPRIYYIHHSFFFFRFNIHVKFEERNRFY